MDIFLCPLDPNLVCQTTYVDPVCVCCWCHILPPTRKRKGLTPPDQCAGGYKSHLGIRRLSNADMVPKLKYLLID